MQVDDNTSRQPGIPQSNSEQNVGKLPDSQGRKDHKIVQIIKIKLASISTSISKNSTISTLSDKVSKLFKNKSDFVLEPTEHEPAVQEPAIKEKLTSPPSLNTPHRVPRRADASGLQLPTTLTETAEMRSQKYKERANLMASILQTKSLSKGPASQRLVSELKDKLAKVEGEIYAIKQHLETFQAPPLTPADVEQMEPEEEVEVIVEYFDAPPDAPSSQPPSNPPPQPPVGAARHDTEHASGADRKGKRPMPPPPSQKPPRPSRDHIPVQSNEKENTPRSDRAGKRPMPPPPRPSRDNLPLEDGGKARNK